MTPPTIQSIATPPPTALYPHISFFVVSFLIILRDPYCNKPLATINIIDSPCLNPTPWECELNLPIQCTPLTAQKTPLSCKHSVLSLFEPHIHPQSPAASPAAVIKFRLRARSLFAYQCCLLLLLLLLLLLKQVNE